jgi:hypothetical protein
MDQTTQWFGIRDGFFHQFALFLKRIKAREWFFNNRITVNAQPARLAAQHHQNGR